MQQSQSSPSNTVLSKLEPRAAYTALPISNYLGMIPADVFHMIAAYVSSPCVRCNVRITRHNRACAANVGGAVQCLQCAEKSIDWRYSRIRPYQPFLQSRLEHPHATLHRNRVEELIKAYSNQACCEVCGADITVHGRQTGTSLHARQTHASLLGRIVCYRCVSKCLMCNRAVYDEKYLFDVHSNDRYCVCSECHTAARVNYKLSSSELEHGPACMVCHETIPWSTHAKVLTLSSNVFKRAGFLHTACTHHCAHCGAITVAGYSGAAAERHGIILCNVCDNECWLCHKPLPANDDGETSSGGHLVCSKCAPHALFNDPLYCNAEPELAECDNDGNNIYVDDNQQDDDDYSDDYD
jgi:hypothetical protein